MKDIGYYPKGPIHQHKSLATGAPLETTDGSDKETVPDAWGGQKGVPGKIHKSGTSTGSVGRKSTVSHKVTPA